MLIRIPMMKFDLLMDISNLRFAQEGGGNSIEKRLGDYYWMNSSTEGFKVS